MKRQADRPGMSGCTSQRDSMRGDFDLAELYEALNAQREARGLTWAAASREISAGPGAGTKSIASSTITGLRSKQLAEADGVLQMLRWLQRSPESFTSSEMAAPLPSAERHQILRFDTRKLYDALEAAREDRRLTWQGLSIETGVYESHMRGLKRGGRTAFPMVMRLTRWLRRPALEDRKSV